MAANGGGGQERRRIAEMVDDQPGGEPAQRGADALSGGDRPLRHIVMPGAAHQIGDQQRGYRAENPGADTIEQLHPINQALLLEKV